MRALLWLPLSLACIACSRDVEDRPSRTVQHGFPLDIDDPLPPEEDVSHVYQCWLGEGVTVARSPSLDEGNLPRLETRMGEARFRDITLPDGRPARAVAVRFLAPRQAAESDEPRRSDDDARARAAEAHPVEVVVARSTRDVDRTLSMLRWLLAGTWVASMVTCAWILGWLVRLGLAPLDKLSRQIRSVDEERLDQSFELPGAAEELEPVVAQLNGFVVRIREAFEREHAFTAHAAHELRTPLAGLRSTLEVSLSRARAPGEYEEAERACLSITMQLQRLVERLLELARAAAPDVEKRRDDVEFELLVDECWLPLSDDAAERGVYLAMTVPSAFRIVTDRLLLRRVLQNLLENAADYADPDSPIDLVAETIGDGVRITCSNAAASVERATAEHAFEPFWRSDPARSGTRLHAGLGLALCKSFVDVLGGRITASAESNRFTVTLDLEGPSGS